VNALSELLGIVWLREEIRWRVAVVRRARGGEEGQGLVEYALIIALLAVVAVAALQILSGAVGGVLTRIAGRLSSIG
jgi:pilus assembly protein Flp/PilA